MLRILALSLLAFLAGAAISPADEVPVETITLLLQLNGEKQKLTGYFAKANQRVELPQQRFAFYCDEPPNHFTGLELRDGLYWEFDWNRVKAVTAESSRAKDRLKDLLSQGLIEYDKPIGQASEDASLVPHAPQLLWKSTGLTKKIGAYTCTQWKGEMPGSLNIEAWCTETPVPAFDRAMTRLRSVSEPMETAAVHPVLPASAFVLYDAIRRAGVTPIEFSWGLLGSGKEMDKVALGETGEKTVKPSFFEPPTGYRKTQLVALEGVMEESKNAKRKPPPGTAEATELDTHDPPPNANIVPPQRRR